MTKVVQSPAGMMEHRKIGHPYGYGESKRERDKISSICRTSERLTISNTCFTEDDQPVGSWKHGI